MILIKNASFIVTQDPKRNILKNYDILIENSKIKEIKKNIKQKPDQIIDAKNKIVLPGLINLHTHIPMALLRGVGDDMELFEWLKTKIWPLEQKHTKKDFYLASILGCIEMIKFGTTCFNDMYCFADEIAKACKKINMRASLSQVIMEEYVQDECTPENTEKFIKKWNNDELIIPGIAPHAVYTCLPQTLKKSKEISDKYNKQLHIHIAETKKEVDDCKKTHKATPAEYLEKLDILNENTVAAHCIWLNDKEILLFSKRKVNVAHCPVSNMKLASGLAPITKMLKNNINVGLGTDSVASNNNLDLFEEMKSAALIQKLNSYDPTIMPAQIVLDMATINGAKALKINTGSIEKGKLSDIILMDIRKPHLQPVTNIISHLVYSAQGQDVDTTIINGKLIMKNRKILGINENKIFDKAQNILEKLLSKNI